MLKNEAAREGKSVNQFIKDIIHDAKFGTGNQKKHSATYHDLDHLFGKWDKKNLENSGKNRSGKGY
ncbi:MAG: hypothetical protein R2875_14050 [Desulfobacterales bacterium]